MRIRSSTARFLRRVSPPEESGAEEQPASEAEAVPPALRDSTPRGWNIWELERLGADGNGEDEVASEERTLLLRHLRPYADAAGDLPVEFDRLVREAFGADLAGIP